MATTYSQTTEENLNRKTRINVRLSEGEKRKFEKLAKANHTDLSEFIRQLLHRAAEGKAA